MVTRYRYYKSCVEMYEQQVNDMKYVAKQISLRTFRRYVDPLSFKDLRDALGYSRGFSLRNDWHVSYHRSKVIIDNSVVPCVYLVHSAIEHVFIPT